MQFLKSTFQNAVIALIIAFSYPGFSQDIITPNLEERISVAESDDLVRINIRLADQYDSELLRQKTKNVRSRNERREIVTQELKTFSKNSQKDIMSFLTGHEKNMQVDNIMPLWIVNVINCYATPEVIEQISGLPGVVRVDYDQERQILELSDGHIPPEKTDALDYNPNTAWNVDLINAPQVWEQGFTGQDIVVAVMDTGVNPNHQDLAGRMWTHPDYPNHGYNFVNNNFNTSDIHSHGTHCAGTVAGNGTAGTTTGIAPGATIMALKVLNDSGGGTESGVWAAVQFAVDYGAHIMSLSLGWPYSANPDRSAWRTSMVNAMEAGVIAAVAAGNEGGWGGPAPPSNLRTPGDCPPPWTHPDQIAEGGNSAVVTVGSTTQSDAISGFSSRGPVTWQNIAPFNDYAYNPGTGLIAPDVVAPGSDILSLSNTNNSGYTVKSGTSMAAPAVAGVMALMLSKNQGLTPEEISQILEETTLSLSANKSNIFGSGRVDALAAVEATPYVGIRFVEYMVNDEDGNNNGNINSGENILLGVTMENPTEEEINDVSVTISTDSEYVTLNETTADLGNFQAGEFKDFFDIFSFAVSDVIPGNYEILFVLNATSPDSENVWLSRFSIPAFAPHLEFLDIIVDDSELGNDDGILDPGETATIMIPVKNTGKLESDEIIFNIESDSPWITFNSPTTAQLDALNPDTIIYVAFEVTASLQTPLESISVLDCTATSGAYQYEGSKELIIGEAPLFTDGDIPSTYNTNVNTQSSALEPGVLTLNIPEGATITSVDVEYQMTARNGAWLSEQRSFVRCVSDGGTTESSVTSGPSSNSAGTHSYNRTGLTIANGVEGGGDITFELHAFRTWGGSGSNIQYNFVPNNTWKVIVHYELPGHNVVFIVEDTEGNPLNDAIVAINGTSYPAGQYEIPNIKDGEYTYSVSKYAYETAAGSFTVDEDDVEINVFMQALDTFEAAFEVKDLYGNEIDDAVIAVNGVSYNAGQYVIDYLVADTYSYSVSREGYETLQGSFTITDSDITEQIKLQDIYTLTFDISDETGTMYNAVINFDGQEYTAGRYTFAGLVPGTYEYSVSKDGYYDMEGQVTIESQDVIVEVLMIELGHEVTFIIKDQDGINIEDAIITFAGQTYEPDVYHLIGLKNGLHAYTVSKEGYFDESASIFLTGQDFLYLEVNVALNLISTNVQDLNQEIAINIYPNPTRGAVTLDVAGNPEPFTWTLTNYQGQILQSQDIIPAGQRQFSINLNGYSSGIYYVRVDLQNKVMIEKIILQ